eukprot:jgi/Chlat1/3140/Chrsp21S03373
MLLAEATTGSLAFCGSVARRTKLIYCGDLPPRAAASRQRYGSVCRVLVSRARSAAASGMAIGHTKQQLPKPAQCKVSAVAMTSHSHPAKMASWHKPAIRSLGWQRARVEQILIAVVTIVFMLRFGPARLPESIGLGILAACSIYAELRGDVDGMLQQQYQLRTDASAGVALGIVILPWLFAAKLASLPPTSHLDPLLFRLWAAMMAGFSSLAALAAKSAWRRQMSYQQFWPVLSWVPVAAASWLLHHCCGLGCSPLLLAHASATACLTHVVLTRFPRCCTAGEAFLLVQALVMFVGEALMLTACALLDITVPSAYLPRKDHIDWVVQAVILGVLMASVAAARLLQNIEATISSGKSPDMQTVALFYSIELAFVGGIAPLWLHAVSSMTRHPLLWALDFALADWQRLLFAAAWAVSLLVALPLMLTAAVHHKLPQIILRKAYHVLAVGMFLPAFFLQRDMLRLSFGVAAAALLFVEALRCGLVPPLGNHIHSFMTAFTDKRDGGILILSHFSLLFGMALPLWMSPASTASLAPFAGLLCLGIGDTMASCCGYYFGKLRVAADSRKTVEGTIAGIVSTSLASIGILLVLEELTLVSCGAAVAAAAAAGLLEAYTTQLDNAFCPLLHYSMLLVLLR